MKERSILITLIFITFSNLALGQKIYSASRDAYKSNKFNYEFYLFRDSTSYLKGHYRDNSVYFLYKGQLKKANDTLYQFIFQPVVNFGCNKGIHGDDSLRFYLTQTDTILSSFSYQVKTNAGVALTIDLKPGVSKVYVKGSEKQTFSVDTKFVDPLTKENILYNVGVNNDPDFTYYGAKTTQGIIQVSIIKNLLTIYPDHKFIQDKDTFILKK
ncbi:MAG: hypothetical protein ABI723_11215 [Bacteroidia bacterium]